MTFKELNIIQPILKAIEEKGYNRPTPIQQQAIPVALSRKDILGCAQTGTGKTASFAIPIIQLLQADPIITKRKGVKALILTPTRELALQISECLDEYARYTPVRHGVMFGGVNQRPQVTMLQKGIDILVATPGRLLDLMSQGFLSLDQVKYFVLDEADRMLDMGFIHDIKRILPKLPKEKQTLFFSATMPDSIVTLASALLKNPVKITITPESPTVDAIEQFVYFVEKAEKGRLLISLLRKAENQSVLVFSRTKHNADRIVRVLGKAGIGSQAIHGNKSQAARQSALGNFKSGKTRVMVATDIAARGIDINELPLVINYDLPDVPETYVHRIGRTGRAGREGKAFNLVVGKEVYKLREIQRYCKTRIIPQAIPSLDDVTSIKADKILDQVGEVLQDSDLSKVIDIVEKRVLEEDYTTLDLAAALLKMMMGEEREELLEENRPLRELEDLEDESRRSRGGRNGRGSRGRNEDVARLFINIGKNQGIRPGDILGAIAGESGMPGRMVGSIDMFDNYTFVEVPREHADVVLQAMRGAKIKGKNVHMEKANRK